MIEPSSFQSNMQKDSTPFDFGIDISADQPPDTNVSALEQQISLLTNRQQTLITTIQSVLDEVAPLLINLKKNPEIEMIKWPDRVDKINKFQDRLQKYADIIQYKILR